MSKELNSSSANRFKYQSFNDRIKLISIDVVHKIKKQSDDTECFFKDDIKKWKEMNGTNDFSKFLKDIRPYSQSLAQVLYHKENVADVLIKHLSITDTAAFEPLLSLCVSLARDLQEEFLPFYPQILSIIMTHVHRTDSHVVEATFNTIAYLFKYLSKNIALNPIPTFDALILLLSDSKDYVRVFAAESFGFVLRKIQGDKRDLVYAHAISTLRKVNDSALCDGLALLFFESIKHIQGTMHSKAPAMIRKLINMIRNDTSNKDIAFKMLQSLVFLSLDLLNDESIVELLEILVSDSNDLCTKLHSPEDFLALQRIVLLINSMLSYKTGSKITERKALFASVCNLVKSLRNIELSRESLHPFIKYFTLLCLVSSTIEVFSNLKPMLDFIFELQNPKDVVFICSLLLEQGWQPFGSTLLVPMVNYMQIHWTEYKQDFLLVLQTVFSYSSPVLSSIPNSYKNAMGLFRFPSAEMISNIRDIIDTDLDWINEMNLVCNQKASHLSQISAICSILPFVDVPHTILQSLTKLLISVSNVLSSIPLNAEFDGEMIFGEKFHILGSLAGNLLTCISKFCAQRNYFEGLDSLSIVVYDQLLVRCDFNSIILQGIAEYLFVVKKVHPELLSSKSLESVYSLCKSYISSHDHRVRLYSLEILVQFEQLPLKGNKDSSFSGPCPIFQYLLDLENMENSVAMIRTKVMVIRKLELLINSNCVPEIYEDAVIRYMLALFTVGFTPLWEEALKCLVTVYAKLQSKLWAVFYPAITSTVGQQSSIRNLISPKNVQLSGSDEFSEESEYPYNKKLQGEFKTVFAIAYLQNNMPLVRFAQHCQSSIGALDCKSYSVQLIKILENIPSLVEIKSKEIVSLFYNIVDNNENNLNEHDSEATKPRRLLIMAFLKMFSKVKNIRKLHSSEKLYQTCLEFLSNGESKLQQLALDCIVKWGNELVCSFSSNLHDLTNDDKFRDTLSSFDMPFIQSNNLLETRKPLMQVLVRILYGKLISRSGRNSKHGLKARRKAIFAFLCVLEESDIGYMMQLMAAPFAALLCQNSSSSSEPAKTIPPLEKRYHVGFLNMLDDCIAQLRSLIKPFLPQLLNIIFLLPQLSQEQGNSIETDFVEEEEIDETKISSAKDIKILCIQRLKGIFALDVDFDFTPFLSDLFKIFVSNKIPKLQIENTQAPSALLQLFQTWSSNIEYAGYLFRFSSELMPNIISLLSAKKVHESVISLVLNLVENIQENAHSSDEIMTGYKQCFPVVIKNLNFLLLNCLQLINVPLAKQDMQIQGIRILSNGVEIVEQSEDAKSILQILIPFLKKSSKSVSEKIKTDIIMIFINFINVLPDLKSDLYSSKEFSIICQLFSTIESQECRQQLLNVLSKFKLIEPELEIVHSLLEDLNAASEMRMDEPDFKRQFDAFAKINQEHHSILTPNQWLPIVYHMIFAIQDVNEYATRSSSSFTLELLIKKAASTTETTFEGRSYMDLVIYVLFPAIKNGLKKNPISVRSELVNLLGILVKSFPQNDLFSDMVPLLGIGEESSFFENIHHLQSHRRVKAIRELGDVCEKGLLKSASISNLFVPILGHFIFELDRVNDHNFINEVIKVIGACSSALSWGHYYALIKRFMNAMQRREDLEKILIRIIVQILDKFHFVVSNETPVLDQSKDETMLDVPEQENIDVEDTLDDEQAELQESASNVSEVDRISTAILTKLLPSLHKILPEKDDEKVPSRISVALALAKLLQHFPQRIFMDEIPRLLTKLCNLLRSRLQDTRDSTRDTLVSIALLWGPKFLHFIISQLKTSLTRGYQVHVLSYTVHSLMVAIAPVSLTSDLDAVVEMLSNICMEDIFGVAAQEKEVDELKGKMKEMKGTKSYDTLELLSKVIGFESLANLLLPIKEIMMQSAETKTATNLSEIFRRLAVGLNSNEGVKNQDLLTFIHELVNENLAMAQASTNTKRKLNQMEKNYKVQMKRSDPIDPLKMFSANSHIFVEFGLSILLTHLRRETFDFRVVENQRLLEPFVDVLGNSLYSVHDSITIQSLKIFCIIIKYPIQKIRDSAPTILKRLFSIIRKSTTLASELSQAAFRLLTIMIRDCSFVNVTQQQLTTLIILIRPDLEEPDRQSVVFSMIKAILSRKYVVNEIYELMDDITRIMVTNQTITIRNLCRQSFIQFLLDYPHGKTKLRQQINFVFKGLEYEHESGRLTILEALHDIITLFSDEILFEFTEMIFMGLILNLVNDESCRELTGHILISLFKRMGIEKTDKIIIILNSWFNNDSKPLLQRMAAQAYGLIIDSFEVSGKKWILPALKNLSNVLESFTQQWNDQKSTTEEIDTDGWELAYYCLNTLSKACVIFSGDLLQNEIWTRVSDLLLYPHSWIRTITSRLLGQVFNQLKPGITHALILDEPEIRRLCNRFTSQLDSDHITSPHAIQIIKNLNFCGKKLIEYLNNSNISIDQAKQSLVANDDIEEEEEEGGRSTASILWLTKKLSFLARSESGKSRGPIIRKSVFQWFAAIISHIPIDKVEPYLESMIGALYRVTNDETLKGTGIEDLKAFGNEVLSHLQKAVGNNLYIQVYNSIHLKIQQVRQDRKTQKRIQAIVDPESRAIRKAQKNDMKRAGRKRKAASFSRQKVRSSVSKKSRVV